MKFSYTKHPLTFEEQVTLLESRGLLVVNLEYAHRKIFFVLSIIRYLLEKIDGDEYNFKQEIKQLFAEYSEVPLFNMGFPEDWEERALWREI